MTPDLKLDPFPDTQNRSLEGLMRLIYLPNRSHNVKTNFGKFGNYRSSKYRFDYHQRLAWNHIDQQLRIVMVIRTLHFVGI